MFSPAPLPQIITNKKDAFIQDIATIKRIDVDDAFKIWKIQTTSKKALQDEGRRCENLFWRILGGLGGVGCEENRPSKHISGRGLAPILSMIFNGEDAVVDEFSRIPTKIEIAKGQAIPPTPPPSPLTGSKTPSPATIMTAKYEQNQPSQTALSALLYYILPESPASPPMTKVPDPSPATPRPGLPRSNQSYPMDSTTHVGVDLIKSSTQRESNRGQRKQTTFAANTKPGASSKKIRPKAKRNGSSSSTTTSVIHSPVNGTNDNFESLDTAVSSPQPMTPPNVESPMPTSNLSEEAVLVGHTADSNNWVVAPDFRTRFQEQRRKSQLSPEDESDTRVIPQRSSRVKLGRVVAVDSVVPLKAPDPPVERFPNTTFATLPASDGLEKPLLSLPRTKSQLSMLFAGIKESDKNDVDRGQADHSSGKAALAPPVVDETVINTETMDDGFEDEEDEVLEMAVNKTQSKPKLKSRKSRGKERRR